MADTFKRLAADTVLESRVFRVDHETWLAPDGATIDRHTIRHPGAVAIIAIDSDDRILMLKQFRPAVGDYYLEIPAGTLEPGENIAATARRELAEETGYGAKCWRRLGAVYTAPGFCDEVITLFLAWDLFPQKAKQDEDEYIQLIPMERDEVRKAALEGRICDAKTITALWYMQLDEKSMD